ncbi:eCIS core domain-containing protein [Sphaerotilus microaerophilus]|uniref:eCIS core domain-containing protein n=1 Tax=Sphaerotilus microaerophilus TaxID=2914710 RepID=A0ABN6PL66_9BURK|nr:DUF4157 domain-containing protein [Sphaerotilus sp. FB-5]BDI05919.1 hypothetical protein CATMQ487_28890 [Sphaerotilus sp. FB-5]
MACAGKCAQAARSADAPSHAAEAAHASRRASGGSNQAALRAAGLQAKLTVGATHDPAEQEADRLADSFAFGAAIPKPCCNSCAESTPPGTVRRSPLPGAAAQPAVDRLPLGEGTPLAGALRAPLERHLDADLSAVRVHTDQRAASANERIGAHAFAHGSDIAFGRGQYAPHTTEGRRLIAHEVVHTVQQGRGAGAARERGPARVRGDNGKQFTPEKLALFARWNEQSAFKDFSPPANQDPRVHWSKPGDWGSDLPRFENGVWIDPKADYSNQCPSCHKRPWEVRAERQRREAEQAKERREAAWPGMHAAQKEGALDQQAKTLREDILSSRLAAAQSRLALFDAAATAAPSFGDEELLGIPAGQLPPDLKSHWLLAEQAAVLVDQFVLAPPDSIAADTMAPVQKAWVTYYGTISQLLGAMDRLNDKIARRRAAALQKKRSRPKLGCPTNSCHSAPAAPDNDFLLGPSLLDAYPDREPPMADAAIALFRPYKTEFGPLVTRANAAIKSAQGAKDIETWKSARLDYRWTVSQLDTVLKAKGGGGWGGKERVEQLEFTQGPLERQQEVQDRDPEALKVQAVFYPKHEFEQVPDEKGGTKEGARGIPWHFYLLRTKLSDYQTRMPAGYTWELIDITAPKRDDGRTVTHTKQMTMLDAQISDFAYGGTPVNKIDPPYELFAKLNNKFFFPEGHLYWRYPVSGKPGSLETTAPRSFGDWLKLIGMAVALIGGVLLPMLGAPAAVAFAAMAGGTALSIAGSFAQMEEMREVGKLTESAKDRLYWDIALDIANMLTLGLGKVATVARAANAARVARVAESAYFYVRRAEIAMDAVNVGIVSYDLIAQYKAIQGSKMNAGEKQRALQELFAMGLLSGALSYVSLRAGVRDWNKKPVLRIDVDPADPARRIATFDEVGEAAAEAAQHDAARKGTKAKEVTTLEHIDPHKREVHTYRLWDDGRITRCSEPPCLLMSRSLVERVTDMSDHMLAESTHHAALQDLASRASDLQEVAAAVGRMPKGKQKAAGDAVLARAKAIEDEMATLRKKIDDENLAYEDGGFTEAGKRYGDAAQQFDKDKYGWIFVKKTGTLRFQRKSIYVPRMEWDGTQFVKNKEKPLFPQVDPAVEAQVRATSETKDFNIVETITKVEDLRRLRPASPFKGRRPTDWVLVKINDDNLVDFGTEAIPHGTIFEFPGGRRAWRTPHNTIATDAPLGAPIGRQGWEAGTPSQLRINKHGVSNEGVDVMKSTGVDHERAHARGQGTGFELYNHILLAPTYVNQTLQARGIELYLSELKKARPTLDLRLSTEHRSFEGTTMQQFIDYRLSVVENGERRELFAVRIETDYSNKAKPARTLVLQMPKTVADFDLVTNTVDMGAALDSMETAIREARTRKAAAKK